jgi:predicted ATP-dependent endonuclease of OLD family
MYRNILDSTRVEIEKDITSLVGKNESGKTAALEAIYRLKPAHKAEYNSRDHYPRWLLSEHRDTQEFADARPIEAELELEPSDIAALTEAFGDGVVTAKTLSVQRDYKNVRSWTIPGIRVQKAIANLLGKTKLSKGLRKALGSPEDYGELTEAIDEADTEIPQLDAAEQTERRLQLTQLRADLASRFPSQDVEADIRKKLAELLPTFFYFSDYSRLEGRVDLEAILDSDPEDLDESDQTALALLRLAKAADQSLLTKDYEERKSELEAVANRLTREVAKYWSQGADLHVDIDIEIAEEDAAVAKYLQIRVRDRRHGFTNSFSQRSSGFRWFFSFMAAFSEYERRKDRVVILLDEPALTLHGKAQADFLRFINERLAPHHQVVYTTHSPFMVETGHLNRVRLVEDKGPEKGSVISQDVLANEPDTMFPLQAALGYDIAQSLFIGAENLVFEGTSDWTYITVIDGHLKDKGRPHLNPALHLVGTRGATNIPAFLALFGKHLKATVLIDSGGPTQKIDDFVKRGYLKRDRVVTVGDVLGRKQADIEDLFEVKDYVALYNEALGKKVKEADLPPGDRVIERLRQVEGDYDHGEPAEVMLRKPEEILRKLSATTLSNFEALFVRINHAAGFAPVKSAV